MAFLRKALLAILLGTTATVLGTAPQVVVGAESSADGEELPEPEPAPVEDAADFELDQSPSTVALIVYIGAGILWALSMRFAEKARQDWLYVAGTIAWLVVVPFGCYFSLKGVFLFGIAGVILSLYLHRDVYVSYDGGPAGAGPDPNDTYFDEAIARRGFALGYLMAFFPELGFPVFCYGLYAATTVLGS